MDSNSIINYLLGSGFELNIQNEIRYISDLGTSCKHSLLFCKYDDYNKYVISGKKIEDSVILVPNVRLHTPDIIGSNIIIPVDDPRYRFGKCILRFEIRGVYGRKEPTEYIDILKTAKILSKTAKIYNAVIGEGCAFHHNVLIGVDDFTPMRSPDGSETILLPQLGGVKLGDRVEVFSNSIVSRGTLRDTEVGDDTKIDAFVQVGHNCRVGKNCMITAGVIIAGSCTIGDNTYIGIGSHIRNGLTIGKNVTIAQGSNVVKDIPDNAVVMGNPAKIVKYNDTEHKATDVPCNK